MVLRVTGIHAFERSEHVADRVAHALGGPPLYREVGLNVVERQPAMRSLKPHGKAHDVLQALVWHREALCFAPPGAPPP